MRWLLPLLAMGCGEPEDEAAAELCDEAPVVTWESFGAGFVTESCQPCHASTSPDRVGAPLDVVFDTEEDVWDQADRVLAVTIGPSPTMPPAGGVSEDDRTLLEIWLTCDSTGQTDAR